MIDTTDEVVDRELPQETPPHATLSIQRISDREEWDEYVLEHDGHPLQLWGWGKLKAAHGWTADRYVLLEEPKEGVGHNTHPEVIAAAQVLTRRLPQPFRALSYIPRGPVGSINPSQQSTFLNMLANVVKEEYKSLALVVEPATQTFSIPHGWRAGKHTILPKTTVQLDIRRSESDLLATMAKKTRQYIRKSAAESIEIRRVKTVAELNHVLEIYRQTSARAGFQLHDDTYYHDVFTSLADNTIVFASYIDDAPVAFLWLAISADTAFELYGGMNEQGAELRANYALKWHAIRKTKEWGIATYDFGGLVEGGVTTFKEGWSEGTIDLAGTYDKPLSPLYGLWNKGLPAAKKIVRTIRKRR